MLLYETYLYEDFLINALAGRHLNNNRIDDSSIYRVKDEVEIQERQNTSWRKVELEEKVKGSTIAYKMTDIGQYLPLLQSYYPETKVIITRRDANEVFRSIKQKEWFTNTSLSEDNRLWPFTMHGNIKVPFFVQPKDVAYFAESDELHRIAYYYIQTNTFDSSVRDVLSVSYQALMDDPEKEVRKVADFMGRKFGPKTDELLKTISRRAHGESEDLVSQLRPEVREQVLAVPT